MAAAPAHAPAEHRHVAAAQLDPGIGRGVQLELAALDPLQHLAERHLDLVQHGIYGDIGLPQLGGQVAFPDRVAAELLAHEHRSEEHTSELQSLMRISYAVFCLKKKKQDK